MTDVKDETVYELPTNQGIARLSPGEPRDKYKHLPPNSGNVTDTIYENAVYGGAARPDQVQEFNIYNVDWTPVDTSSERMNDVDAKATQTFQDSLNTAFGGWVYREDDGTIYVLER